jgi:hypothetical protein
MATGELFKGEKAKAQLSVYTLNYLNLLIFNLIKIKKKKGPFLKGLLAKVRHHHSPKTKKGLLSDLGRHCYTLKPPIYRHSTYI